MTVVYISRHSEPFKKLGKYNTNELEQIKNEKTLLSINGENKARKLSEFSELNNIDILYSSSYVRAISTAKYIAEKNDIVLNVDARLGERKFGVNNISELPANFGKTQFRNMDYKLPNGESINEVSKRMNEVLLEVINNNKNKKIMIISHATSITAMLSKWCSIKLNEEKKKIEIFFKDKLVFDGNWQAPELFRLEFDNEELINIENIEVNYE